MGGKVLVPTQTMIKNLKSARLAADVMGVPLIILARTDANAAKLITSDIDENDKPFLTGKRSPEGFHYVKDGLDQAISRGLAYAPYSDLIWCETGKPNLEEAKNHWDVRSAYSTEIGRALAFQKDKHILQTIGQAAQASANVGDTSYASGTVLTNTSIASATAATASHQTHRMASKRRNSMVART